MKDTERKSVEQLFDLSEQFETRWQAYATIDAAERQKLIDGLAGFVRLCSQNGIFIPPGSADRRALRSILDRWNSRLREAGVDFGEAGLLAEFDPKAGVVLEGPCPYPGLDAYSASRRGSFFGRENEIAKAVKHLDAAGNRIMMIVGSSGSGKSSLALAGILPRLQDEHASVWLFARPFTPGTEPITALAEIVADVIGQPESAPEIRRSLAEAPEQAHAKLAAVCEGRPLMLLIDQFEELLTLCHDPDEQGRFARILCSLSDPSTAANGFVTLILLTLRTDHLDRFERTDALLPLHRRLIGEHNSDQLSTIGFAEIRRAIKEPADSVGLRFVPPELVDRLTSQTAGLSNGLPLLQFALQRLWETRPRNADGQRLDLITREMVDGLPDVQGALGRVAAGLFKAFTQPAQRTCERLLLELVVLDENFEEPLRRRRGEIELIGAMERSGYAVADIERVVGEFMAQHLVRRFGERPDSRLEVAHEALLRHWPHISDILTGSNVKERLHLIKEIGREAAEWVGRGRTDDELRLHGDRLARAVACAKDGWLVEKAAAEYLEACQRREAENVRRDQLVREQRERVEAAERARREAELKEERLRTRIWQSAVAAAAVLLVVIGSWWWIEHEALLAHQQVLLAESTVNVDPQRSLLQAQDAARHGAPGGGELQPNVEHALRSAIRNNPLLAYIEGYGHTSLTVSALSPDNSVLVTGDSAGGMVLWDARTGAQRKAFFEHVDSVGAVAFSPDGQTVASGGADGKVVVWDVERGRPIQVVAAHGDEVTGLAFSRPDGRLLASASYDGTVRLWDVSTGELTRTLRGHVGSVRAMAFGRDNHQLVTAGEDDRVVLWDAVEGRVLYSLDALRVRDVDLSADGNWLAVADNDGVTDGVTVWDTVTRGRLLRVAGHTNSVLQVRFSGDHKVMATASYDGAVRVWRMPRPGTPPHALEVARFAGNTWQFTSLSLGQNGAIVAATGMEGKATVWAWPDGGEQFARAACEEEVPSIAFRPDGEALAAVCGDGRVSRWNLSGEPRVDADLDNLKTSAEIVAYSRDGTLAVGAGPDVLVLRPSAGQPLPLKGHQSAVKALAFSPDGMRLVSASEDKTILWKIPSGDHYALGAGQVRAVAYSPDGRTIATGDSNGAIRLWGADSGKEQPPQGESMKHQQDVLSLAFSPDGSQLVSASRDKMIGVWDAASGKPIGTLSGHEDVVTAVAISANEQLATASDDTIRLWNLRSRTPITAFPLQTHGARSLAFSRDGRYLAAGARDGSVRVYAMRGQDLVALAEKATYRGWTKDECNQYEETLKWPDNWLRLIGIRSCPSSRHDQLEKAHASLEAFDVEKGRRLLREALKDRTNNTAIEKEVNARVDTTLLSLASYIMAHPTEWTKLKRAETPVQAAGIFLEQAKQSPNSLFDHERRSIQLIAYEHVKQARERLREGQRELASAAFAEAGEKGWPLPAEPTKVAAQLWARDRVKEAWDALKSPQPSKAEVERHTKAVKEAVSLEPTMGTGWRVLGRLYVQSQDMEEAERHLRKAAEFEPSVDSLVLLAQELIGGAPEKAQKILKQALEREPGFDDAWFTLGQIEYQLQHWADAVSAFDRVSPAAARFAEAVHIAGAIRFMNLGDYQGAYVDLTRATELAPDNLAILTDYTENLFALGRFDQTRLAAFRARELPEAGKSNQAYLRAALTFYLLGAEFLRGEHQEALLELDKLEVEVKASAAGQEDSFNYAGTRRVLEKFGVAGPPADRDALMKVLEYVSSNGQLGSLDDMRRILASGKAR